MWRFKTEEEFIKDDRWVTYKGKGYPRWWNANGEMNNYLGSEIPPKYHKYCEEGVGFNMHEWAFGSRDYILEENYEIY